MKERAGGMSAKGDRRVQQKREKRRNEPVETLCGSRACEPLVFLYVYTHRTVAHLLDLNEGDTARPNNHLA